MSNKHAIHRAGRDRAVAELLQLREAQGNISRTQLEIAARDCNYSPRQLLRQLAKHDADASVPADDETDRTPFTEDPDVVAMVMQTCGNFSNAYRRLTDQKKRLPSLSTFRRHLLLAMGATMLAFAKDASRAARVSKVYLKRTPENRGFSYLLDHTELPIYVIPDGYRTATRPWMTAVMDAQTRYILSWVITFGTPTAEEIRAALISAFTPRLAPDGQTVVGGAPERALWDRGLDFLSDLITLSCLRLQVTPVALPGYSPHLKGSLERFWRFLKENALAPLPGYIDAGRDLRGNLLLAGTALNESAFLSAIEEWVDYYNTGHVNRSLGMTALQAWQADSAPLREIPADQLWTDFLLSSDSPKVGKAGVRHRKIDYVALNGELDTVFGRKVEIRHLPHDRSFIEVFHNNKHLATCYPSDQLRPDDQLAFLEARRQTDAAARKAFSSSNRLRAGRDDSQKIKKVTGKGTGTSYQVVGAPELDLYANADEALAKYTGPAVPEQQGRLL